MRLDIRAVILALWMTLLLTTLTSTATIDYYENVDDVQVTLEGLPTSLENATLLVFGFWIAGLASGLAVSLLGWPLRERNALLSGMVGFAIGTLMRLLALGQDFLPGTDTSFWDFMSKILAFHDIPDYHAFLLLVWLGGFIALALGVMMSALLKQTFHLDPRRLPALDVEGKNLVFGLAMLSVSMLFLLVLRNFETENRPDLTVLDTKWLILPLTNMVFAALIGFFMGGGYFASSRFSAAVTMFLSAAVHVTLMLAMESYISTLDAVEEATNLNNIAYLNFIFFWVGTPVVGAIAALALHNLRDAFTISYEYDYQDDEPVEGQAA